jgi:hypothetical protein
MTIGQESGSRPPGRGNGLSADSWAAIADLDPRIADDILIALHRSGIAAYVEPTPATAGGYLEQRLPSRPTDRVFADAAAALEARELVAGELAEIDPDDLENALLPSSEPAADPMDEHFVPPPAPPLPRLRPTTVVGLAAIALGIAIIVFGFDGGQFSLLGVLAIIAGVGSLIWHMKDGPPADSGWDDGAVL